MTDMINRLLLQKTKYMLVSTISVVALTGCGSGNISVPNSANNPQVVADASSAATSADSSASEVPNAEVSSADTTNESPEASAQASEPTTTEAVNESRDNTPACLIPEHPGTEAYGNEYVDIDVSNASEGYVCISYLGSIEKVKVQITCPNTTTYTYNLHGGYEVFPLTIDSGTYRFVVLENQYDNQYSTAFTADLDLNITNLYGPYLYPNQYVTFDSTSQTVAKAKELADGAKDDLEVLTRVYNYVISNVQYDTEFAQSVGPGYTPYPDNTLASQKGICLDYAALMCAMLRSQRIPTHMEVGYAGTAYHAWISVFLDEIGWVNGIIEFDGNNWELMDPTFAASSPSDEALKEFIGDGSNYDTKYIY